MPVTRSKAELPCQNCRGDDNRPRCHRCERAGERCLRESSKPKFRHGSKARYDANFKKDQPWVGRSRHVGTQYVDQTPNLESYYAPKEAPGDTDTADDIFHTDHLQASTSSHVAVQKPGEDHSEASPKLFTPSEHATVSPYITFPNTAGFLTSYKHTNVQEYSDEIRQTQSPFRSTSGPQSLTSPTSPQAVSVDSIFATGEAPHLGASIRSPQAVEAEYRRLADTAAAAIPDAKSGLLSPEVWRTQFFWPNAYTTTQCACLMRYYIEELGPWFDVCDPARHFTIVVPQRARRCPPLLNAIFTAAARHLAQTPKYKTADDFVEYLGVPLRNLTPETAIRYHNACIAYLIELSTDPEHVQDEDLLAAAVILRYYEELDSALMEESSETFSNPFQVFMNAQAGTTFSPPAFNAANSPGAFVKTYEHQLQTSSTLALSQPFRHASLRVALRQDIASAFLKQRPIELPLNAWVSLRSFSEAEDAIWTDRLSIFCADVLQFCFGDDTTPGRSQVERWRKLKDFERLWDLHKPLSFGAIHHQEANPTVTGSVFPQIWYLAQWHVAGMQYLDLGRILLTVYDPTVPRLGLGATAAARRVMNEVQKIALRLCGTATSNRSSQPALIIASIAISVCGEYFADHEQQKGMLNLLLKLEHEYAWPTAKTARDLKRLWAWTL